MARSSRCSRRGRFRQHPQVDHREFWRATISKLSRHPCSGDGRACRRPNVAGSRPRDEIMADLRTLHVARHGRRGSHFLMYRAAADSTIEIVRILHDRMDFRRHVPPASDEGTE
nr:MULTISPECIES: type II toxin-antitoxin system RelE/ParE family toxin [unclassified Bradyrhizobium]